MTCWSKSEKRIGMSLTYNGQAIFLFLIHHSTTYRAYPVSLVFFHIGGTTTGASRGVGVDLIHKIVRLIRFFKIENAF